MDTLYGRSLPGATPIKSHVASTLVLAIRLVDPFLDMEERRSNSAFAARLMYPLLWRRGGEY